MGKGEGILLTVVKPDPSESLDQHRRKNGDVQPEMRPDACPAGGLGAGFGRDDAPTQCLHRAPRRGVHNLGGHWLAANMVLPEQLEIMVDAMLAVMGNAVTSEDGVDRCLQAGSGVASILSLIHI